VLRSKVGIVCMSCFLACSASWGQSSSPSSPSASKGTTKNSAHASSLEGHLAVVQTVEAPAETIGTVGDLTCDHDGYIYLGTADPYAPDAVHKLNSKGEKVASFQSDANPDLKIDVSLSFALGPSGELYQLVFPKEITRYVFVYKPDGTFKSAIKLQPGFPWHPSVLAVFPQGSLLVSGLEYDRDRKNSVMWPFNGIFSSDGTLLREVKLEDDETLHDLAGAGDARVTSPTNPSANHAIQFSKMEAAADGNIYVMRWTNPAIFYAVSPGGEVLRRFTVDPGDASLRPVTMHVSGSKIAVLFAQKEREEEIAEIVDLEGHAVATYRQSSGDGKPKYGLGLAFACYSENPERFTFLSSGNDSKLKFLIAEPR
jgi:hypothetical protein